MIPHTTPQLISHKKSRPLHRTAALLAAAFLLAQSAGAAPIMSPPQSLDAKGRASVLGQLTAARAAQGLDQDHSLYLEPLWS